jgi:hypothetical protein
MSTLIDKLLAEAKPEPRKPQNAYGADTTSGKVLCWSFADYERDGQEPVEGCKLVDTSQNYDLGTWGGTLVGTREAIAATIAKWGTYAVVIKHNKVSLQQALRIVDEEAEEGDPSDSGGDADQLENDMLRRLF